MIVIKPAMMRHRIDIQSKQRIQDASGLESFDWVNLLENVPAEFRFLSGNERLVAAQTQAQYKARVTIYMERQVEESMRIVFDGQYFDIVDKLPDPTNELYENLMVRKYAE